MDRTPFVELMGSPPSPPPGARPWISSSREGRRKAGAMVAFQASVRFDYAIDTISEPGWCAAEAQMPRWGAGASGPAELRRNQHWDGGSPERTLGDAAQERPRRPVAGAPGAQRERIGAQGLHGLEQHLDRDPVAHLAGGSPSGPLQARDHGVEGAAGGAPGGAPASAGPGRRAAAHTGAR